MKSLARLLAVIWLSGSAVQPAAAAFSSLYAFGDGVCTTTGNLGGGAYYYGNRYCNGRIWLEVLAQRQGVAYEAGKTLSYFAHYSSDLATELSRFSAPDANTALFVVWVNDADFVWDMENIYPSTDLASWNAAISSSLTNHFWAVTNLYAKGVRTLIMPNAVDLTKVPQYAGVVPADKAFIRQRVIDFNTSFVAMLDQAKALSPGLTISVPDFFNLLDTILANPADYGLVNPGTYALADPNLADYSLGGPGAQYVFWDYLDPSAKAQEIMADVAQQLISPARVSQVTFLANSNRLDATSLPIGLAGFVEGTTNLVSGNWVPLTNFGSVTASQPIFVPASGPQQYYRLRFPFAWVWP